MGSFGCSELYVTSVGYGRKWLRLVICGREPKKGLLSVAKARFEDCGSSMTIAVLEVYITPVGPVRGESIGVSECGEGEMEVRGLSDWGQALI